MRAYGFKPAGMNDTERLSLLRELALALLEEVESLSESRDPGARRAGDAEQGAGFYELIEAYEKFLIERALLKARGNQAQAARILGLKPTTLHNKIKAYDIKVGPKVIDCGGGMVKGGPDPRPQPKGAA